MRIRSCRPAAWEAARRRRWIALVASIWAIRQRGSPIWADGSSGGWQWRAGRIMHGDSLEEPARVVSGESPVERIGQVVVAVLEGGEPVGDLVEVEKVVGGDDFALDDEEDDLDLIQPRRVDRQVDEPQVGPGAFEAINRCLTAVRAAVVDQPEHPLGRGVGLDGYMLREQPPERLDPRVGLCASEQAGSVHVIAGQ